MLLSRRFGIILAIVAIAFVVVVGVATGWSLRGVYEAHHVQQRPVSLQALEAELLSHASAPNANAAVTTASTDNEIAGIPKPIPGLKHPPKAIDLSDVVPYEEYLPKKEPAHTLCRLAMQYVIEGADFAYTDTDLFRTQFYDLNWAKTQDKLLRAGIRFDDPGKARELFGQIAKYGFDNKYLLANKSDVSGLDADNLEAVARQCPTAVEAETQ